MQIFVFCRLEAGSYSNPFRKASENKLLEILKFLLSPEATGRNILRGAQKLLEKSKQKWKFKKITC